MEGHFDLVIFGRFESSSQGVLQSLVAYCAMRGMDEMHRAEVFDFANRPLREVWSGMLGEA